METHRRNPIPIPKPQISLHPPLVPRNQLLFLRLLYRSLFPRTPSVIINFSLCTLASIFLAVFFFFRYFSKMDEKKFISCNAHQVFDVLTVKGVWTILMENSPAELGHSPIWKGTTLYMSISQVGQSLFLQFL